MLSTAARAVLSAGTAIIRPQPRLVRGYAMDNMMTFDQATRDGLGAFLIGELERLDPKLHEPLVSVTWSRDIDLRTDVSVADETSSFTNSSFAAAGGLTPGGKAWISKDANEITGVALDIGKTAQPLYLWGMETKWTLPELASAEKLGRPIDAQKFNGMRLKHEMDTDEMVYIGDSVLPNAYGLCNSPAVPVQNAPNGASGNSQWIGINGKTPAEMLADVNKLITDTWAASGWAVIPSELRLPPAQYAFINSQLVSGNGSQSILKFLMENNLSAANGGRLRILPLKWLIGAGTGGTPGVLGTVDRMVAYTKNEDYVRYPMTALQRTQPEYRSLWQIVTYWGRLGVMEFPYPETVGYMDGI